MINKILVFILFIFNASSYALLQNSDKIEKADKKVFNQVKLQAGSYVVLDQFMKRKHDLKDDEDFELKFICKKEKKARVCKVIEYKALKKQKR